MIAGTILLIAGYGGLVAALHWLRSDAPQYEKLAVADRVPMGAESAYGAPSSPDLPSFPDGELQFEEPPSLVAVPPGTNPNLESAPRHTEELLAAQPVPEPAAEPAPAAASQPATSGTLAAQQPSRPSDPTVSGPTFPPADIAQQPPQAPTPSKPEPAVPRDIVAQDSAAPKAPRSVPPVNLRKQPPAIAEAPPAPPRRDQLAHLGSPPSQTITPVPPAREREMPPAVNPRKVEKELGGRNPFEVMEKEVGEFVQSYLTVAQQKAPEREAAFYADSVEYFTHGKVDRRFILADQRNYYKRWPVRDFTLVEPPKVVEIGPSDVVIKFRMSYTVRGGGKSAKGVTENRVRLRRVNDAFKITSIREKKENG